MHAGKRSENDAIRQLQDKRTDDQQRPAASSVHRAGPAMEVAPRPVSIPRTNRLYALTRRLYTLPI